MKIVLFTTIISITIYILRYRLFNGKLFYAQGVNKNLNICLKTLRLSCIILNVKKLRGFVEIEFSDGYKIVGSNLEMEDWFSRGTIYLQDSIIFSWTHGRPNVKEEYIYKQMLKEFNNDRKSTTHMVKVVDR